MQYRIATHGDIIRILEIIRQAQAQMRALGSEQWQNGYPAREDIERDIAQGYGVVATVENADSNADNATDAIGHPWASSVIAYAAVVFDGEPAYEQIEGSWRSNQPYVVVHRLAVANEMKGRGIATNFMRHTEQMALTRGIHSFRVDTNFDNLFMQRMLATLGFTYRGEISYQNGMRRAYEKLLTNEKN